MVSVHAWCMYINCVRVRVATECMERQIIFRNCVRVRAATKCVEGQVMFRNFVRVRTATVCVVRQVMFRNVHTNGYGYERHAPKHFR